jgi:hypothetical protein
MKSKLILILSVLCVLLQPTLSVAQKLSAMPQSGSINSDGRILYLDPDDTTLAPTGTDKTITLANLRTSLSIPAPLTQGTNVTISGGVINVPAFPWGSLTGVPSTLSGYGITDPIVLTSGSYPDPAWITALAWAKLTGVPTSLAGLGITNGAALDALGALNVTGTGAIILSSALAPSATTDTTNASNITGGTLAIAQGGTGTASPGDVAGTGITITGTWPAETISATGGGGAPVWGAITGTLTDQTDLDAAIAAAEAEAEAASDPAGSAATAGNSAVNWTVAQLETIGFGPVWASGGDFYGPGPTFLSGTFAISESLGGSVTLELGAITAWTPAE